MKKKSVSHNKKILDACCGSKMFWFNPKHPDTLFIDKRKERFQLKDSSSKSGQRELIINPDLQADFTELPFDDSSFALVVFDPPHLLRNGDSGWLAKKYGKLKGDWKEELRDGFKECFRVLRPDGVLVFKWTETDIRVSEILQLTPAEPLFGNKNGKRSKGHWIVFMKESPQP